MIQKKELSDSNPLEIAFEKKKQFIKATLTTTLKRLNKSLLKSRESLNECLQWEKFQHQAILLQNNFSHLKKGLNQITLLDFAEDYKEVTLILEPKKNPKDQVQAYFKRAKKLKTGIEHQRKQILHTEKRLKIAYESLEKLENSKNLKELLLLFPEKKTLKKKNEKPLPYREYQSKSGFKILVGKSSRANDTLTFQYAKGSDLWLHVKDYPGSHVVIVKPKNKEVDHETILDAAELACFYSKAKDEKVAEVCLTEKKYVSRFSKNKDGKVQISHQKTISVRIDQNRISAIRNSSSNA